MNKISGTYSIFQDDTLRIYCTDENGIENNSPTHFNIRTYADMPPEILVFDPTNKIELDESMEIPLRIMVNDDYGISEMEIKYSIIHPDYIPEDTTQYRFPLAEFEKNIKSQNYSMNWDINFLYLMPEDEVLFRIGAADNNTIPKPSWTYSKELKAFYPSLEDMFFQMEENENEVMEEAEDITLTMDEVQELVEDLKLDLLKSEEMDWEQSQQTEEVIKSSFELYGAEVPEGSYKFNNLSLYFRGDRV